MQSSDLKFVQANAQIVLICTLHIRLLVNSLPNKGTDFTSNFNDPSAPWQEFGDILV